MIVIKQTLPTSYGPRRHSAPGTRGVRVVLAEHELSILVAHYEKAEREAAKAGATRAAEVAAWRAATLRRRPVA